MILNFVLMPAECRKEVIVKFHFVCIALINQEKQCMKYVEIVIGVEMSTRLRQF